MVAQNLEISSLICIENTKIEKSVRGFFFRYEQELFQDQVLVQTRFNQSKEYIYKDHLYILLLLIEWYKLAQKDSSTSGHPVGNLLKDKVANHPLLAELYENNKWVSSMHTSYKGWLPEESSIKNWYARLIQPLEVPSNLLGTENSDYNLKILEYIVQNIIFQDEQVQDFFSMMDFSWNEHKRVVQKILSKTFETISNGDFSGLTSFWNELESEWIKEGQFYNCLLQKAIENSNSYEAMIGEKSEKWDSDRIILIDKIILKLALVEMIEFPEIPFKVSLNEYIEIAKLYGTPRSGKFVNGILESIYKGLKERFSKSGKLI